MQLIVFTGLPGAGKSSIAEPVGRELGIPVFAKDWLEAALRRSGADQHLKLGYAGYELLTTLAERQLRFGQSAILDSVAGLERLREPWRKMAASCGATWRVIECLCSDESVHRARLATRQRGIPGWFELTWEEVERVRAYYEPWQDERLVLDMVNPLEENIQAALTYLRG
jgi:predicted kinase